MSELCACCADTAEHYGYLSEAFDAIETELGLRDSLGSFHPRLRRIVEHYRGTPALRAQVDALQPPVVADYDARETRAYAEGYRRAVYDVLNRLPEAAR